MVSLGEEQMGPLALSLMGPFQAMAGDAVVVDIPTAKARALVAYLALNADRPHARTTLAALLWPELADGRAMSNLRKTLHRLRLALDMAEPDLAGRVLRLTRRTVSIDPDQCVADAAQMRALLEASAVHAHRQTATCEPCLERLSVAAGLCRGELLAGLALSDAPEFEEWLLLEREATLQQALRILSTLAEAHTQRGAYALAQSFAARQLAFDPCREEAHRQAMRALALAGEREAALDQYATCQRLLAELLGVGPGADTLALYERIQQGQLPLGADAQAARSAPRVSLPAVATPFVGRASELRQIREHFDDPACRLVTLLGAGGMGKTRLAIRAARQLAAGGSLDSVTFVSLVDLPDADALPVALAAALDLPPDATRETWRQVLDYLRAGDHLLLLDSAEHLPDVAPRLAELLLATAGARLLVTSRTPLALRAERRLYLDGLALGPAAAQAGDEADAVQLFAQAARRVRPDFTLTPESAPAVRRICRLVQGMPLALEIAASWARALDCEAIADEIGRNMAFLVSPLRDMPERHRSIEAVFTQSWRLLTPAEQGLLARLSIFHGAFSLDAAATVAGATVLELAGLLDNFLLRHAEGGRYELHELVRQFAARRLIDVEGGPERIGHRHADYYLGMLAGQEAALYGATPPAAVAQIQRKIANIEAAWQWATEHRRLDTLVASLEAFARFHEVTARFAEAEQRIERTLRSLRDAPGADGLVVRLLIWQGRFAEHQNHYDPAVRSGQDALRRAGELGDREAQALAHRLLGVALPHKGEFARAAEHLRLAITHFTANGDQRWRALALLELGITLWRSGAYAQAAPELQAARAAFGALGDSAGLAQVARALGGVHFEQGDLARSLALVTEAARRYETAGDRWGMAMSAGNLALVHGHMGQFERALEQNQQDLETCRALGHRHGLAVALGNRASFYAGLGQLEQAVACVTEALEIEEALGNAWERARHLAYLGKLALLQGAPARALACVEEALPVLRARGIRYYVLAPLQDQAEALSRLGRPGPAAAACAEALALAEALTQPEAVERARALAELLEPTPGAQVSCLPQPS